MSLSDRRRHMAASVAGALAVILIATPAAADPDPGKGPPDVPKAPVAPCAVVPSGNSEFASCVGVTAKLDRVPSVGATATLTATIRASRALPGMRRVPVLAFGRTVPTWTMHLHEYDGQPTGAYQWPGLRLTKPVS
jgi:hypothetical protein